MNLDSWIPKTPELASLAAPYRGQEDRGGCDGRALLGVLMLKHVHAESWRITQIMVGRLEAEEARGDRERERDERKKKKSKLRI